MTSTVAGLGRMEQLDGAEGWCSGHLAGPGSKRKGWAELAPWRKALLALVLPASKDFVGVGGIAPSPGLLSPALMSPCGFMTSLYSL